MKINEIVELETATLLLEKDYTEFFTNQLGVVEYDNSKLDQFLITAIETLYDHYTYKLEENGISKTHFSKYATYIIGNFVKSKVPTKTKSNQSTNKLRPFIPFPSIERIKHLSKSKYFKQLDKRKLKLIAYEKIHGTNAACVLNCDTGELYFQKRSSTINENSDNADCFKLNNQLLDSWGELMYQIIEVHNLPIKNKCVVIDFEWAGGSLFRNKSACSGYEKLAVVFPYFRLFDKETNEYMWFENSQTYNLKNIKSVSLAGSKEFELDLDNLKQTEHDILDYIKQHELSSPFGNKVLGLENNIMEGVVCYFKDPLNNLNLFKVKGEKHEGSRNKQPKELTPEQIKAKSESVLLAENTVSEGRLQQIYNQVFGFDNEYFEHEMKYFNLFIEAINMDLDKECRDEIAALDNPKAFRKAVGSICINWYKSLK